MNQIEGWDTRAFDKQFHYFINNKALCGIGSYHPPYFDRRMVIWDKDHCRKCSKLLESIINSDVIQVSLFGYSEEKNKGFKIGDVVRMINPTCEYERNLILRVVKVGSDGFIECKNVKEKKSCYMFKEDDIKIV